MQFGGYQFQATRLHPNVTSAVSYVSKESLSNIFHVVCSQARCGALSGQWCHLASADSMCQLALLQEWLMGQTVAWRHLLLSNRHVHFVAALLTLLLLAQGCGSTLLGRPPTAVGSGSSSSSAVSTTKAEGSSPGGTTAGTAVMGAASDTRGGYQADINKSNEVGGAV